MQPDSVYVLRDLIAAASVFQRVPKQASGHHPPARLPPPAQRLLRACTVNKDPLWWVVAQCDQGTNPQSTEQCSGSEMSAVCLEVFQKSEELQWSVVWICPWGIPGASAASACCHMATVLCCSSSGRHAGTASTTAGSADSERWTRDEPHTVASPCLCLLPTSDRRSCAMRSRVGVGVEKMELSGELQGQLTRARRGMIRWVSHGPQELSSCTRQRKQCRGSLGKGDKKQHLCYAWTSKSRKYSFQKTVPPVCICRLHCLVLVLSLGVRLSWFHVMMKDE